MYPSRAILLLSIGGSSTIGAFTEASRGAKERRELDQWDSRATEKLRSRERRKASQPVLLYLPLPSLLSSFLSLSLPG